MTGGEEWMGVISDTISVGDEDSAVKVKERG
jgi:hypothetical protein